MCYNTVINFVYYASGDAGTKFCIDKGQKI